MSRKYCTFILQNVILHQLCCQMNLFKNHIGTADHVNHEVLQQTFLDKTKTASSIFFIYVKSSSLAFQTFIAYTEHAAQILLSMIDGALSHSDLSN